MKVHHSFVNTLYNSFFKQTNATTKMVELKLNNISKDEWHSEVNASTKACQAFLENNSNWVSQQKIFAVHANHNLV